MADGAHHTHLSAMHAGAAGQALDIIGRIFQHQFQNGRLIAVNMQAEIVIHTYSP